MRSAVMLIMGEEQNSIEQQVNELQQQERGGAEQPSSAQNPENPNNSEDQLAIILTDLDRRLRTLEERYSNLRNKLQLSDQNMLESERNFIKEIRVLNDEVMSMKHTINEFTDKVLLFNAELDNAAKKIDMKVLEKYLILWNPQNFVTRNELKEYLRQNNIALPKTEEKKTR